MKKIRYMYLSLIFGFLLGIHNGYIALWQEGNGRPLTVFPYQAKMLPAADQAQLSKGIHISSHTQLQELLEDYLS